MITLRSFSGAIREITQVRKVKQSCICPHHPCSHEVCSSQQGLQQLLTCKLAKSITAYVWVFSSVASTLWNGPRGEVQKASTLLAFCKQCKTEQSKIIGCTVSNGSERYSCEQLWSIVLCIVCTASDSLS